MTKPAGRVLVVGSAACRAHARTALSRLPFEMATADDPYAAALELCRRPLAYRAMVLCLTSIYREELALISVIKDKLSHIDVYLAQTDGRQSATVEAMRRGAAGLLGEDGFHRFNDTQSPPTPVRPADEPVQPTEPGPANLSDEQSIEDPASGEAVLTPEELRALLQEQPAMPPSGGNES